jgi:hypothetical protein
MESPGCDYQFDVQTLGGLMLYILGQLAGCDPGVCEAS